MVRHVSGHWSFPKGHPEEGETYLETAKRELAEETTLKLTRLLTDKILKEHYHYRFKGDPRDKTVTYFIGEVEGEVEIPARELIDSLWVSVDDAANRATFAGAKKLCADLMNILRSIH